MDGGGNARAFPAEQQGVAGLEGHVGEGPGAGRGQKDKPARAAVALKGSPGGMPDNAGQIVIIHGGAADPLVVERKAAGFDDVERHAQASRQTDESAEILWDIGLVKG